MKFYAEIYSGNANVVGVAVDESGWLNIPQEARDALVANGYTTDHPDNWVNIVRSDVWAPENSPIFRVEFDFERFVWPAEDTVVAGCTSPCCSADRPESPFSNSVYEALLTVFQSRAMRQMLAVADPDGRIEIRHYPDLPADPMNLDSPDGTDWWGQPCKYSLGGFLEPGESLASLVGTARSHVCVPVESTPAPPQLRRATP